MITNEASKKNGPGKRHSRLNPPKACMTDVTTPSRCLVLTSSRMREWDMGDREKAAKGRSCDLETDILP